MLSSVDIWWGEIPTSIYRLKRKIRLNNDNIMEAEITVIRETYYKDDFGIIKATVDKVIRGELKTDKEDTTFKGTMPKIRIGEGYKVVAEYVEDKKWGGQYNIRMLASAITLDDKDEESKRRYLASIFTKNQVTSMYKSIPDPYSALKDENAEELIKVTGCGMYTADQWIRKFHKHYRRALIYAELHDYNLSAAIIDKLLKTYKSPELVIQKIKEDPYSLVTDVKGVGWATADTIAVAGGLSLNDPKRIRAYMYKYLEDKGENGYSWITEDEFLGAVFEQFGEDIPDQNILDAVELLTPYLWRDKEEKRLGLSEYYEYENLIAQELLRIRNSESKFSYDNWEEAVKWIEKVQGWEYIDEQIQAIKAGLQNNVILIQGSAGSGKSSMVRAILEVLKGHPFVQCAVAGKAASRLMEVTGQEGYTIHRLLGFPKGDSEHQGFRYNQDNPLTADIYIIDEISMVDMKLFYYLLRAIPDGAKVICLGDNGQLEAIGAGNIAYDMLVSPEIPSYTLTKIHRQAESSAIVTESIKIRSKYQIIPEDWTGHEVRGELKDLDLTCYSDASNTYYEVMKAFSNEWNQGKRIMDLQVIVPMKQRGGACTYNLNNAIQEICNPKANKQVMITTPNGDCYLRVGDKVINSVNNYKTKPNIYNGNLGIITDFKTIQEQGETVELMVIDFDGIGKVELIKDYWKNIELAYALTTHRSQGSEFDTVIFGLDFSAFKLLTKELVYTGITRAKKKCYLIAQNKALRYATTHSEVRQKQTHLQKCLHDLAHPKIIF